jgi:hypothetical protein
VHTRARPSSAKKKKKNISACVRSSRTCTKHTLTPPHPKPKSVQYSNRPNTHHIQTGDETRASIDALSPGGAIDRDDDDGLHTTTTRLDDEMSDLNPVWKAVKPYMNGGLSGMGATCVIQPLDSA